MEVVSGEKGLVKRKEDTKKKDNPKTRTRKDEDTKETTQNKRRNTHRICVIHYKPVKCKRIKKQ